jgi:hypothetical protein
MANTVGVDIPYLDDLHTSSCNTSIIDDNLQIPASSTTINHLLDGSYEENFPTLGLSQTKLTRRGKHLMKGSFK